MMENINALKAAITAILAALTALWGWFGWLVLAWVACMVIDVVTGVLAAARSGKWSSSVMKEGISGKAGCLFTALVALIFDALIWLILSQIPSLALPFDYTVLFCPSALYIRSTPSMLRELGLPDAPMAMTARHVKDINHAPGDNLSWHGIPEEQIVRIPELLDQPAMVLESGTRPGDIIVVTTELDSEGRPIVLTVHPNGRALVDGRPADTNFITSMYGRNNFGRFLDAVARNGGVLYWDKNRSQDLLTAAGVQFPAGMRDLASNSVIRKIGGAINENRSRPLSSVARVQSPAALTASASDTTIPQPGTDVNGESGSGTPRFSIQEDDINPETGYERGSVADSLVRMINAGDVDEALQMMGDALKQLQDAETRQASARDRAAAAAFRPKRPLTEDVIARNKREIQALIDKYGAMPQTGAAQRTVALPRQTDQETRTRGFVQTAAAAEHTPEYIVSELERSILDGDAGATYTPIRDESARRYVDKQLESEDIHKLIDRWRAKVELGQILNKNDIALGERLYIEAANSGDVATAMQLLADIAVAGTQAGQVVQAMTMLKNMTPSGQLYYLQRTVDRLNSEIEKRIRAGKAQKITIDPALAKALLEAKTQTELDAAMEDLVQQIAGQVPVTLADKLNAWRYLAMLGNAKTHLRNFFGNAAFIPARLAKDTLSTIIEAGAERSGLLSHDQRTKTFLASKEARDFARADVAEMEQVLRGGGRENISDRIRDARRIFKLRNVEEARKLNSRWMEKEDWIFLSFAYKGALARFLTARGVDLSTLKGEGSTREGRAILNEARLYAIREAQKATYRDASALASTLNQIRRAGGPGAKLFLDAIVPFTKTPINIVRRGLEYSPLGLLKSISYNLGRVRAGELSATEAIDHIAAGLTGTGIILLGYFMAKAGLLVSGFGDDPEDEFRSLQGEQEYALRAFGHNYTIDWLAPTALPLFVGAEADNLFNHDDSALDGNVTTQERLANLAFNAVPEAISTLLEPVLAMSMVDGLNNTLESVRYDSEGYAIAAILKTAAENYVSQFFPTSFGQLARTIDDSRRTSFTPKGMGSFQSSLSRAFQSSVQSKIPVYSEGRMRYIDAWGRPDTQPSLVLRALENFFSPGYASKVRTTDMEEELLRLARETGDAGVFPKRAAKSFKVNGEDYAMTQEEYEAHLIDKGQTSYALLTDLVYSPDYAALSDKEKARAVEAVYDYASQRAKYHTSADYDIDAWVRRLDATVEQFGLDPSDYFTVKAMSAESGKTLREAILDAGFDPATTAELLAFDFSAQGSFTDPYTTGYEYVLNSEQKERYESMFREKFVSAYTDYGLGQLTGAELSDEVSDLVSEINAEVKREMSDWLYGQGISPTQKK